MVRLLKHQGITMPEAFHRKVTVLLYESTQHAKGQYVEIAVAVEVHNGGIIGIGGQQVDLAPTLPRGQIRIYNQFKFNLFFRDVTKDPHPSPAFGIGKDVVASVAVVIGKDDPVGHVWKE